MEARRLERRGRRSVHYDNAEDEIERFGRALEAMWRGSARCV
jgi:selenocysteine lyase/cysteine desulfurase